MDKSLYPPIIKDSNYIAVFNYVFDDMDDETFQHYKNERPDIDINNYFIFNEETAAKIIKDFTEVKDKCDVLVVHCDAGVSRSPAVAIFLMEKFNIPKATIDVYEHGESVFIATYVGKKEVGVSFLKKYFPYNHYVYDMLKHVSAKSNKNVCLQKM